MNQVIRSGRDFWIFHVSFWALAAAALFLYGLTYGHVQVAAVRNLYSPLVGFAFSYLIKTIYDSRLPSGFGRRLLLVVGLSCLGALVSAMVVNPITYGLLGYEISDLSLRNLLQDGLYFVLLYLVWSLLYLQLVGRSLVPGLRRVLYQHRELPEAWDDQFLREGTGSRRVRARPPLSDRESGQNRLHLGSDQGTVLDQAAGRAGNSLESQV
jgi:hypothetical protein